MLKLYTYTGYLLFIIFIYMAMAANLSIFPGCIFSLNLGVKYDQFTYFLNTTVSTSPYTTYSAKRHSKIKPAAWISDGTDIPNYICLNDRC